MFNTQFTNSTLKAGCQKT